jgi:esterase/lipase superfamily enzyme
MRDKGIEVRLDIWPGWAHDWPYWKDMMRTYLSPAKSGRFAGPPA